MNHYESILTNLWPPTAYVNLISLGPGPPPYTSPLIPLSSLLYSCPPVGDPKCSGLTLAGLFGAGSPRRPRREFGFTHLYICNLAFTKPSHEAMLAAWRRNEDVPALSTILLHEMQHADEVTGIFRICEDYSYNVRR